MNKLPIGTFINMATVIIGSLIGVSLQQVFPDNIQSIIFQAIGLASILIGIQMSLKVPDGYLLILIFSMILGGIIGEVIHLDLWLNDMGDWLKQVVSVNDSRFTEGLVTAFLLFCIGSMTIVGAIEEGLRGKRELLMIKSTLDGITSIAFASTYGIGVLFSIIPMLILQGGMTVMAKQLEHFFTNVIIAQLSAAGGLLIIAIGFRLLNIGQINIENLLPSLLIVVLLSWAYEQFLLRFRR
ncbi:MAG: DUF554 domain-containing protein [Bacteroidota bacterium]